MTLILAIIFLNLTLKAKATEAKINKWDHSKLKICTAEETTKKNEKAT